MGGENQILPGCYYPGCSEDHNDASKWCPRHSHAKDTNNMAAKKSAKKSAKKAAPKKAAKKKAAKKAAPKKAAKEAAPKKAATKSPGKRKGTPSKGKATVAQKKAALAARYFPKVQWKNEVETFKKSKDKDMTIELGSPGSAQVTRCRLIEADYCKGLTITTQGAQVIFEK